jgi:hypothetical protein
MKGDRESPLQSNADITQYIEIVGERGRIGKSTISNRVRDHLEAAGVHVQVARIENRKASPPARKDDIRVFVDDADQEIVGGVAAIFDPVWAALMEMKAARGGALIVDFMAGAETLRTKLHMATSLSELLGRHDILATSLCVTTRDAPVMEQALDSLKTTAKIAPSFQRVLAKNELTGRFSAFSPASEQASLDAKLRTEKGVVELTFPLIQAAAWQLFEPTQSEMRTVLESSAHDLSAMCQCSELIAQACQNWLAAWWAATEEQLNLVWPFPETGP